MTWADTAKLGVLIGIVVVSSLMGIGGLVWFLKTTVCGT